MTKFSLKNQRRQKRFTASAHEARTTSHRDRQKVANQKKRNKNLKTFSSRSQSLPTFYILNEQKQLPMISRKVFATQRRRLPCSDHALGTVLGERCLHTTHQIRAQDAPKPPLHSSLDPSLDSDLGTNLDARNSEALVIIESTRVCRRPVQSEQDEPFEELLSVSSRRQYHSQRSVGRVRTRESALSQA